MPTQLVLGRTQRNAMAFYRRPLRRHSFLIFASPALSQEANATTIEFWPEADVFFTAYRDLRLILFWRPSHSTIPGQAEMGLLPFLRELCCPCASGSRWEPYYCRTPSKSRPVAPFTLCSTVMAWSPTQRAREHARTPLSKGLDPNDLWCTDYKGELMLGNKRCCYLLTVTDHASRYLLLCEANGIECGKVRFHCL